MPTQKKDRSLNDADLYINRELSFLEFVKRVLAQSQRLDVPLMERLRFICIVSYLLDEFFEIRVAGVRQQLRYKATHLGPDCLSPQELLEQIASTTSAIVEKQYRILNEDVLPALAKEEIYILRRQEWSDALSQWVEQHFKTNILPVLSPIGLDPAHPFPRVLNKNVCFIVTLNGRDAFGREGGRAILQLPRSLPRVIPIPDNVGHKGTCFILLSSIVHQHVADLFPGMRVTGCYQFRVTRDGDLYLDLEAKRDLLTVVEGELPSRRFSQAVRLEVADNCPEQERTFLLQKFGLSEDNLYQVHGPVNLSRLKTVPDMLTKRTDFYYPAFIPSVPPAITNFNDMFATISSGDVLLHHPYQSFSVVLELLRQAVKDPNVLAIKQTLYRTGDDSQVVALLKEAAKEEKEVTVVIELRARFDEEANIELANELQEVGAHVVYGVVGYKTHAKMMMIIRREGEKLRRYIHLGTGNYHPGTSKLYTDLGLMTCDKVLGEDVNKVFLQLTGLGRMGKMQKIWQAPFTLFDKIAEMIDFEAEQARQGKPARIIAKMNALVAPDIIQKLYQASQAGVNISLIIRGICCLKPGIPGVSENIEVRSHIGRFLEHSRVFYFHHAGESVLYCGSADWMPRSLFTRVEVCFPIENPALHEEVLQDSLENYLNDNEQAWVLGTDGRYSPLKPDEEEDTYSAQRTLLDKFTTSS